ncbi:MAG: L-threonylcarbamoyladenylate synthase [Gammaproteobacteria bacterium]|jgi:L-threonylcarbamoyladenylate synthase
MRQYQTNRLAKAILKGAVIAYPTDTVWGLGCHPLDYHSVQRILTIKNRSIENGVILITPDLAFVRPYLSDHLSSLSLKELAIPMTPPTTWLVPAHPDCPAWLRGRHSTLAIRITNHAFIREICEATRSPIVSTSANRSGKTTVRNSIQARKQFGSEVDAIITGYRTGGHRASRIQSLDTGQKLRE